MYFKLVACYGGMLQLLFSSLFFRNFIVNKNKIGVEYQSFSVIDDTFVTFDLGLKSKLLVIMAQCFLSSSLASGDFCCLLITFANSLDPDQDRQNVGPDLDPNCLTL